MYISTAKSHTESERARLSRSHSFSSRARRSRTRREILIWVRWSRRHRIGKAPFHIRKTATFSYTGIYSGVTRPWTTTHTDAKGKDREAQQAATQTVRRKQHKKQQRRRTVARPRSLRQRPCCSLLGIFLLYRQFKESTVQVPSLETDNKLIYTVEPKKNALRGRTLHR
jgi:hypothetical protein